MLDQICIQNDQITLEAFSSTNISQILTQTFPTMLKDIKSFFGVFSPSEKAIDLSRDQRKFIQKIEATKYSNIISLNAYKPEGLDVTYLVYCVELNKASNHVFKLLNEILNPYTTLLSQLLTSTDKQLSTINLVSFYKSLEKNRGDLNIELGKCFKKNDFKAETNYGSVVDRNNDWEKIFLEINEINKSVNSISIKDLNIKIKECSELLDRIINKIKRGEFNNMSPETITNLSNGAYQVARELEFFSVIHYKASTLTNSIQMTIDELSKII